jgi:hypothetical protein
MPLRYLKQVGDGIADAAGQARDAMAGAYDATRAAATETSHLVAARAASARDLGAQATALMGEVPAVLGQVAAVAGTTLNVSTALTGTALRATPGAIYRVITFDGSMESARAGIVVPLLGHLRHIGENRTDPERVARGLGELAVFTVEAGLKSRVLLQEQIQAGLWALFSRSAAPKPGEDATTHLLTTIRDEVLSGIWDALRAPDLSLRERLTRVIAIEAACSAAVSRATDQLALAQLNDDVRAWRHANYGPSAPGEAQAPPAGLLGNGQT